MSADHYDAMANQAFDLLDVLYTYFFRYPWLLQQIEGALTSKGDAIDCLASNPAAAVGLTLILGATAAASLIHDYRKLQKDAAKEQEAVQLSHQRIQERLRQAQVQPQLSIASVTESDSSPSAGIISPSESKGSSSPRPIIVNYASNSSNSSQPESKVSETQEALTQRVNQRIAKVLQNNTEWGDKYATVEVNGDYVEFTLKDQPDVEVKVEILQGKLKSWPRLKRGLVQSHAAGRWLLNKTPGVLGNIWTAFSLAFTAYWIMWMGAAATGSVSSVGVNNLGMAAYGVPIAVALLYPTIKLYHWVRDAIGEKTVQQEAAVNGEAIEQIVKYERSHRLKVEANADMTRIVEQAIWDDEMERINQELKKMNFAEIAPPKENDFVSGDQEIALLTKKKWTKTAMTFLCATIGAYIGSQYGAWLVSDFLKEAFSLVLDVGASASGLGIAFIVCSSAYGVYKAYQQHQAVKQQQENLRLQGVSLAARVNQLESIFKQNAKRIETLQLELGQLIESPADLAWLRGQNKAFQSSNLVEPAVSESAKPKSLLEQVMYFGSCLYAGICGGMSGAMIGRIALVVGTVAFIPFTVAALSNPWTIAILVLAGIAYGAIKTYKKHIENKEGEAFARHEQLKSRGTQVQKQNAVAEMQIKLLEAKKVELVAKRNARGEDPDYSQSKGHQFQASILGLVGDDSLVRVKSKQKDTSPVAARQSIFQSKTAEDRDGMTPIPRRHLNLAFPR